MARLIIDNCHDCADWSPGDSYGFGTVCGALSNYPAVSEVGEKAPIPDWCPRLTKQVEEKLTTTNIDYAAALKACDLFAKEGTGEVSMPMFTQFCKERLNSSTNCA